MPETPTRTPGQTFPEQVASIEGESTSQPGAKEFFAFLRSKAPEATKGRTDDELAQFVKVKFPEVYRNIAPKSLPQTTSGRAAGRLAEMTGTTPNLFGAPRTEAQRRGTANIATGMAAHAKSQYNSDIADAWAEFGGTAAAAAAGLAAAPFTAGASLPAALAIAGGAGLAGGVTREFIKGKLGSSNVPRSEKDLMITLGVDTAVGGLSEGLGRTVGIIARKAFPRMIEHSANMAAKGKELLNKAYDVTYSKLEDVIGSGPIGPQTIDVYDDLLKLNDKISRQRAARGHIGALYSDISEEGAKLLDALVKDLQPAPAGVAGRQDLLGMVKVVQSMKDRAINGAFNQNEKAYVYQAIESIEGKIKKSVRHFGPDVVEMYEKVKRLSDVGMKDRAVTDMWGHVAKTMAQRGIVGATIGGTVGGGYGYRRGGLEGIVGGMKEGAQKGAFAGAFLGAPGVESLVNRLSAWGIQKMLTHPVATGMVKRAIDMYVSGKRGPANQLMAAAAGKAGVRVQAMQFIRDQMNPETRYQGTGAGIPEEGGEFQAGPSAIPPH